MSKLFQRIEFMCCVVICLFVCSCVFGCLVGIKLVVSVWQTHEAHMYVNIQYVEQA